MSLDSHTLVNRFAKQGRSQVTNGRRLLIGVDARSKHGRRFRDLIAAYTDEIGGNLSATDQAMVKQAAALSIRAEMMQAEIVNGVAVNPDDMVRVTSESRRIVETIKTNASARRVEAGSTSDLRNYIQAVAR